MYRYLMMMIVACLRVRSEVIRGSSASSSSSSSSLSLSTSWCFPHWNLLMNAMHNLRSLVIDGENEVYYY